MTATLQTLVAFVRKTHASSVRWHGSAELNARLLALSHGWGGKEEARHLCCLSCACMPCWQRPRKGAVRVPPAMVTS